MNVNFSFIVLTLNEEIHLNQLLDSISELEAQIYVLDSGSTDNTLQICRNRGIEVRYNAFINHPRQWAVALERFKVNTPWTIGLDADQTVSPELFDMLYQFRADDYRDIDGIYFNRKNYFNDRWIKHGGYYPMYLLKMFRTKKGYSDLSGSMDHRFEVPGKTLVWENGHIIEKNLKEDCISFWINKHNTYSSLAADEFFTKSRAVSKASTYAAIFGMPNERKVWKKELWKTLPLFVRPALYFLYRLIIQRGFLDGRTGILFHFLQGFWFRLVVDIKIQERKKAEQWGHAKSRTTTLRFIFKFLILFLLFYYFNILFISLSSPDGLHISYVATQLNYIAAFREFYLSTVKLVLVYLGFEVITFPTRLSVVGHAGFTLVYSCLGYGIISCFSAFALAIPKPFKSRYLFLSVGILLTIILNICRLVLISIYYKADFMLYIFDHRDIFNLSTYGAILIYSYLWLKPLRYERQ
jgi:exosortase/archaeosortase family protein